jgi:hypothetical protein
METEKQRHVRHVEKLKAALAHCCATAKNWDSTVTARALLDISRITIELTPSEFVTIMNALTKMINERAPSTAYDDIVWSYLEMYVHSVRRGEHPDARQFYLHLLEVVRAIKDGDVATLKEKVAALTKEEKRELRRSFMWPILLDTLFENSASTPGLIMSGFLLFKSEQFFPRGITSLGTEKRHHHVGQVEFAQLVATIMEDDDIDEKLKDAVARSGAFY